jgi:hypothetical protein
VVHVAAGSGDSFAVRFDTYDQAIRAHALRQRVEAAPGTATDLHDTCTSLDADLIEQRVGFVDENSACCCSRSCSDGRCPSR